jgi:predicted transposase/invertase (TIGR01784 family)
VRPSVSWDVHVSFNDGEQADIEMQVNRSDDDLKARSLPYASRLLESQLGRGEDFRDAKRVYVIFFLDFVLFPRSAKVPCRYVFMEETEHDRLNELIEVVYYEMPKTADAVREYFEGMEPLIDELLREDEGIMRADRALKKIERDRDKRARAIFWDNQRLVRNSDMHAAEEKGRMASREEIARNMIAKGYELEEIQAVTGLTDEEARKLR